MPARRSPATDGEEEGTEGAGWLSAHARRLLSRFRLRGLALAALVLWLGWGRPCLPAVGPSGAPAAVACLSTDAGALDQMGLACADYAHKIGKRDKCGEFDERDFTAKTMCCACGGGVPVADFNSEEWKSEFAAATGDPPTGKPMLYLGEYGPLRTASGAKVVVESFVSGDSEAPAANFFAPIYFLLYVPFGLVRWLFGVLGSLLKLGAWLVGLAVVSVGCCCCAIGGNRRRR